MRGRTRAPTRRQPRGRRPRLPAARDASTTPRRAKRARPTWPRRRPGCACRPPTPAGRVRGRKGGRRRAHQQRRRERCREACRSLTAVGLRWTAWSSGSWGRSRCSTTTVLPSTSAARVRARCSSTSRWPRGTRCRPTSCSKTSGAASASPARNNLQVHVSRLRRALGEDRIATRGGGYALDLPRDALDAARFDRLSAEGRAALHAGDADGGVDAAARRARTCGAAPRSSTSPTTPSRDR